MMKNPPKNMKNLLTGQIIKTIAADKSASAPINKSVSLIVNHSMVIVFLNIVNNMMHNSGFTPLHKEVMILLTAFPLTHQVSPPC